MLLRVLIFLAIALALFLPFNWLTYRQLVRIHPKRRRLVLGALIAGNLMWPFFPLLRSFTPFARTVRAVLGPIWFGWTCFAILYSLFLFFLLIAWVPLRRRPFPDFARNPSRAFLLLIAAGFVVGYVQAVVPLRVESLTVRLEGLPPAAEGARIAILGDLHVGLFTRPSRLQKIFTTTASLDPGVVVVAGDLIDDDPHFVPKLLAGTSALPTSIPLYGVLGNHEMYGDPIAVIERLRGSRITMLINEGVSWRGLWIAGVSDSAASQMAEAKSLQPDLARAISSRPATSLPLVVSHQPRIVGEARKHRVPLVLAAHTHGGQLGFRPLRWSLAGVFLPYHMGLYDLAPTQLYINTGTGYWLLPFRLGMTPEITLIELRSK